MADYHTPVLLREAIESLDPKPGQNYIDCTLGGGGYTAELAKRVGPKGLVVSFDLDSNAIRFAQGRFESEGLKNTIIIKDNFKNVLFHIEKIKNQYENISFNGIVFDLGLSSAQLEDRSRGFSFKLDDSPLVMNFRSDDADESGGNASLGKGGSRKAGGLTAEWIVNNLKERELEKILFEYGEEKFARRIVRNIAAERKKAKIAKVKKLVEIVEKSLPSGYAKKSRIHPATKTFQALRIAVNKETENLEIALADSVEIIVPGGRIAVVSYHSLEDRIVKNFFRLESKDCICPPEALECRCGHSKTLKILTKKPITPSAPEIADNPRARSAKLRVAERT